MKKYTILAMFIILTAVQAFGEEGFADIFGGSSGDSSSGPLKFAGSLGFEARTFFDNGWESEQIFKPYVNLDISADTDIAEATLSLKLDAADLNASLKPIDVIDEMMVRVFFSVGYIDLGLGKVEWGKGDGVHVIDPINNLDQSGIPDTDINRIKRPEIMARLNFYLGAIGQLELLYKPHFHPIETATTGRWMIQDLSLIPNLSDPPDTETFRYSQVAGRMTVTLGPVDLGIMAYYGFIPEPGIRFDFTGVNPLNPLDWDASIVYTRATLMGAEAGWALGPLTFRIESGFWLSEDSGGTETHLFNNRLVWLGGVDILIPGTTIFISLQEFGSYVFNFDDTNPQDVDLGMSYGEQPLTNTLVAAIEGNFFRDTLNVRVGGLYLFEGTGFLILPSVTWEMSDDLSLSVEAQIMGGRDKGPNPYYAWRQNDSVSIGVEYQF